MPKNSKTPASGVQEDAPTATPEHQRKPLSIQDLERKFEELTFLLYDTDVRNPKMKREVMPYIDENIVFVDPWQEIKGIDKYWVELKGFHSVIYFDFDIFQLNVKLNEDGTGGRCIVDGVMNLQQFKWIYLYPLRTILVYEFKFTENGTHFVITLQEEMWSFGDMIQNLPWPFGWFYSKSFRYFAGLFFTAFFWIGWRVVSWLPWSVVDKEEEKEPTSTNNNNQDQYRDYLDNKLWSSNRKQQQQKQKQHVNQ